MAAGRVFHLSFSLLAFIFVFSSFWLLLLRVLCGIYIYIRMDEHSEAGRKKKKVDLIARWMYTGRTKSKELVTLHVRATIVSQSNSRLKYHSFSRLLSSIPYLYTATHTYKNKTLLKFYFFLHLFFIFFFFNQPRDFINYKNVAD